MEQTAVDILKTVIENFGAGGIVIAALAWHDWQIQKRNQALNDALLEITKETVRASEAVTSALRENSLAIQNMSNMLVQRGRAE